MENDCKVMEFLELFAEIINHNVKPMFHYALSCRQLAVTFNEQPIFCH